ncbi:MAG: hypothetical protein ACXAAH_17590 [Promethearchaeota archaeon]
MTNYTFIGSTGTINQAAWNGEANGTVTIRFYANDSAGNVFWQEITVRKDIISPVITINLPIGGQIFNETSPPYNISITEPHFDSAWYTLDNGVTNTTFITLTGSISQSIWDILPNGNYTIRFYANDTLGNIGFSDVTVEKKVVDIQGPSLTSLSERDDPLELGEILSIRITAFDISNISSIQIEIKGIKYNMTNIGGNIYEYQWTPGSAENLLYTIHANDSVGNSNFLIDSVTIHDTTLPTFSDFSESTDLADPGDSVIITLDATDVSGINEILILFQGSNDTMTNVGGDTWSYALTAPDTRGTYYYTIYIKDNNNNINSIEGSFRVGGVVSGTPGEPINGNTIQLFLGIIGILGIANLVLIFKKFRGGKS